MRRPRCAGQREARTGALHVCHSKQLSYNTSGSLGFRITCQVDQNKERYCGAPAAQDGVKLAQALHGAGGAGAVPAAIAEALREFERERTARATPVTVKSRMMGAMLQIRNPLVRGALTVPVLPAHLLRNQDVSLSGAVPTRLGPSRQFLRYPTLCETEVSVCTRSPSAQQIPTSRMRVAKP